MNTPKLMKSEVVFEDESALCCPSCGSGYGSLHQQAIEVFFRPEDYNKEKVGVGIVPKSGGLLCGTMEMKEPISSNPSARRSGLNILLSCEQCTTNFDSGEYETTHLFVLEIYQHKGSTYLKWSERVVKNSLDETVV